MGALAACVRAPPAEAQGQEKVNTKHGSHHGHHGHRKAKSKSKVPEKHGYTVQQFVSDNMVPVFGIICRRPLETKALGHNLRAVSLQDTCANINAALGRQFAEDLKLYHEAQRAGRFFARVRAPQRDLDRDAGSVASEMPAEAICNVYLSEAVIEGIREDATFDFLQEARLEVKVRGKLIFPPRVSVHPDLLNAIFHLEPNIVDKIINVEFWIVLERHNHETSEETQPVLQVRCVHMKVNTEMVVCGGEMETNGDAMADSWLPQDEILDEIETLLTGRLYRAIKGIGEL